MVTSAINTTTATTESSSNSKASRAMADFDTFLSLLTAQLANQDPLNPTDGTEFTAQLAQFSTLEQQINTNDYLKALVDAQSDSEQAEALSYIGKEILAPGSSFALNSIGEVEFSYEVEEKSESVAAHIYNANNELVYSFDVDATEGIHEVSWDGKDDLGNRLDVGAYYVKVEATVASNGATTTEDLNTYFYSKAEKATNLGSSYAITTEDGRITALGDILATRTASNSTASDHSTALQMLGKQVLIPGSNFSFDEGNEQAFTYGLTQDVTAVTITIRDADGNKIKDISGTSTKGSHEITWDGTDSNGDEVDSGEYTVEIIAQNANASGELTSEKLDSLYYGEASKVESANGVVVIYTTDGRNAYYDEVIATKE